ncbi:MAG: phage terminase large subunit, partial [Parcubacteria group bacterium]
MVPGEARFVLNINYIPEPTLKRFHHSDAMIRGVMGCVGSGKSTACCVEILTRSMQQKPGKDGVRRTRWAVIRNTYPMLRSTTIKTWLEWIPELLCPIVYSPLIVARMNTRLPDKTMMDMEVFFLALDTPKDVRKLKSLEITAAWVNEASEVDYSVIEALRERVGRYPGKESCDGLTWYGIIMDTNPPDTDHWWYRFAEQEKPKGWKFFRQPGALKPVYDS